MIEQFEYPFGRDPTLHMVGDFDAVLCWADDSRGAAGGRHATDRGEPVYLGWRLVIDVIDRATYRFRPTHFALYGRPPRTRIWLSEYRVDGIDDAGTFMQSRWERGVVVREVFGDVTLPDVTMLEHMLPRAIELLDLAWRQLPPKLRRSIERNHDEE